MIPLRNLHTDSSLHCFHERAVSWLLPLSSLDRLDICASFARRRPLVVVEDGSCVDQDGGEDAVLVAGVSNGAGGLSAHEGGSVKVSD